jgi:hypothetical protein
MSRYMSRVPAALDSPMADCCARIAARRCCRSLLQNPGGGDGEGGGWQGVDRDGGGSVGSLLSWGGRGAPRKAAAVARSWQVPRVAAWAAQQAQRAPHLAASSSPRSRRAAASASRRATVSDVGKERRRSLTHLHTGQTPTWVGEWRAVGAACELCGASGKRPASTAKPSAVQTGGGQASRQGRQQKHTAARRPPHSLLHLGGLCC